MELLGSCVDQQQQALSKITDTLLNGRPLYSEDGTDPLVPRKLFLRYL